MKKEAKIKLRPEFLKESRFIRLFKSLLSQDDIFLFNDSGAFKSGSDDFKRVLFIQAKSYLIELLFLKLFNLIASIVIVASIVTSIVICITRHI